MSTIGGGPDAGPRLPRPPLVTRSRDRRAQSSALFGRSSRWSNEDIRWWTSAFWAHRKAFFRNRLWGIRTRARNKAAMTSCSISPKGYGTPSRRMTSGTTLRGHGPVLKCAQEALPFQEFDAECAVRLRAHGIQSLELSAWARAARQRQLDAARRLSCLAAGTAESELGGS